MAHGWRSLFAVFALAALAVLSPTSRAADASWPDLRQPLSAKEGGGNKDAALVIGIEEYAFAQKIPGARDNAMAWVSWLKDTRKVPMVKPLLNEQATREAMTQAVSQVASRVKPGGTLWVVYIGHGAPSETSNDGLLVGVDAQQTAQSLAARGLPRGDLLAAAEAVMPSDATITLVVDACFSGKTSSGDLAPGLAPLKVVRAALAPRATVLTAARGNQYAGPLSDGRRPAFSYLVLGALRGWGDADGDGDVTAAEAVAYADDAMVQTITGRSQSPTLEGPDVALGRAGSERGPDLTALAVASAATSTAPSSVGNAGSVSVNLGGESLDFAALTAQAEAASKAIAKAETERAAAEAALQAERRRRLDAAAAEVRTAASRDYDAISSLIQQPTAQAAPVLQAWLARYGAAEVSIDGVSERVKVSEVSAVQAALKQASSSSSSSATARPTAAARQTSSSNAVPSHASIHSMAKSYYDSKGEWKGTYRLASVSKTRIQSLSSTKFIAHLKYRYKLVPGSRRRDSGTDQRTFIFLYTSGSWQCVSMGGHNSGRP